MDFSHTNFMDSTFTGVLIQVGKKIKLVNNGELQIVINSQDYSTNPILLERLEKEFTTYGNLSRAINSFSLPDKLREAHVGNLN